MAQKKKGQEGYIKQLIAQNRKAYHEYHILEKFEAGIVLVGTEVKSLRQGKASIGEAYISDIGGEIYLLGASISAYSNAKLFSHDATRKRKLLLNRRQINKIIGSVKRKGMTIVPLQLYFTQRNLVKLEVALVKGKKLHDKREALKERDMARQTARETRTLE